MSFIIPQCFFCAEDINLIQMDTNSLIIEGVYIDFAQLIGELMQVKLDDDLCGNLICTSCKDQLTQFYLMKKQAAKRRKASDVRKMRIVDTVISFLDATSADFIVRKYSKFLAVHPDTASTAFLDQLQNCNYLLEVTPDSEEGEAVEIIDFNLDFNDYDVKDEMGQFITNHAQLDVSDQTSEYQFDEVMQHEEFTSNDIQFDTKIEEITEIIDVETPPPQKVKRYLKYTLDPKQREWIRKKIKRSAIQVQTTFGNKIQWCCEKCTFKSFNTENAFRLHLRTHLEDATIDNPEDELEELDNATIPKMHVTADDQSAIEQRMWIRDQIQCQKEVMLTHEGPKPTWTCSQCDYVTQKRDRFRMHLQKSHTTIVLRGPSKHSCIECRLRFDGENHLTVHKNCHRIFDVIAPYAVYPECTDCKMLFISNEDLQIHLERHKENPESLFDPIVAIGVIFRNGETFVDDNCSKLEFSDESATTCGHCLMKFATDDECKHHMMLFHATSFVCPFDMRVFDGIPTLSFGNHLRHFHPEIFPELEIACSLCKMQFDTVYDKLAHMKICKFKKFHCDHCEKSFFRKAELIHHLKVVTGLMVFACHLCGKHCKDQGDLKTHLRSHTNDRPYPCPHCEKAYKTSSARASHVESHMDQVHACNICNVKFRRRILFQRHMKLLHDESYRQKCFAENTCKFCGKSYLRKSHYKNHMKTHEMNTT